MDYGAAVEISGFSDEQDGFGSVQYRTPSFCFTAAEGREGKRTPSECGWSQTQQAADWLRASSPMSVSVFLIFSEKRKRRLGARGGLGAVHVPIFITDFRASELPLCCCV